MYKYHFKQEVFMSNYLTPFRYPGGKQKLSPFITELIIENEGIGGHYVEPYAGGAGVAIALLNKKIVSHIHLNDSSYPIYALWNSILKCPDLRRRRIKAVLKRRFSTKPSLGPNTTSSFSGVDIGRASQPRVAITSP